MWYVKVEAMNRATGKLEKKEFVALDTYALTDEQKLLWKRVMGERWKDVEKNEVEVEEVKVTNMRIRAITEFRLK